MRYVISALAHYLSGKITTRHFVYALHKRPPAVISKGRTWVINPDLLF
ncbi:hypothetical protein PVE_R2G0029 [Pseudomonas veronii 1YdBTEX2]|jgi:hypothetical protein|uniref:Uncharacterized protein n=1 Tax=Pseudomonas veronii 1YdBTEX2 TaxID=1295141 RepID=A0A1D3K6U4_PSEVE|nr:hypothetical protein PVE_R2G0029 [Pseudomonas veronii 1YdBTEX2]